MTLTAQADVVDEPDRIRHPWGARTAFRADEQWPQRVDMQLADGIDESQVDRWAVSASLLHSNGDAMDIAVKDDRIVGVRGRAGDRVNRGRLDVKDLFAWQANNSADRLTLPMIRRDGGLEVASWDEAMALVVDRTRGILEEEGPSGLGFYTSGQLFCEEYYTLALIARAGLGTDHLDGNTRLCTATAAEALKESFGSDGQPASYSDVDHAEVIALFGHNVAETQPVLWMRMLDRLESDDPPRLLVVDPRRTPVAERATVHLRPRPGTNLALMNGLLHGLIAGGLVDLDFVERCTQGYDALVAMVETCTPACTEEICGIPAAEIDAAVQLLGSTDRLLATVLQGFYQSHQATAASVAVNNLVLLRGAIGRPGAGVMQMNGQPTAQNTRECGANGDLPGFRNWENTDHVEELARLWNVDPLQIPHYAPPTHAMQIFRYAEQGSIKLLWVSATNPAVSMPELSRIRRLLGQDQLFLVVQDLYLTETALLADVVLPGATWGEKTGVFTNADRTVHLSEQAVAPPGEARSDLDIFLDFAARMDFRDRDGRPLITWDDAESAFEAWKRCSVGRPCDYSALTYELLRQGGVQWPCTEQAPTGTERLYTTGVFPTDPAVCESYGRDLVTGAGVDETTYRAQNPAGRALLKGCEYRPPAEVPDNDFPLELITGRTIYHFHTRTKTGRTPELEAAAPEMWAELSADDAAGLGFGEGDPVEVVSARGRVRATLRLRPHRAGTVFLPFHYGYWDTGIALGPEKGQVGRAANELTATAWDPVSKQPLVKSGTCRIEAVAS